MALRRTPTRDAETASQNRSKRRRVDLDVDGACVSVVAALSLTSGALWSQVTTVTREEVANYVMPVAFGAAVVDVPAGSFCGRACAAHGGEVFLQDSRPRNACVSVYRAGVLQRQIKEWRMIDATSIAVVGAAMYVADYVACRVRVYSSSEGTRLFSFGEVQHDPYTLLMPWGVAALDGRIYVAEATGNRVSVFTERGAFVAHGGGGARGASDICAAPCGQVFVCTDEGVAVLRVAGLAIERYIGVGMYGRARGVCTAEGLLFVVDEKRACVCVFDIERGHFVAALTAFAAGAPRGIAIDAEGTLFVTTYDVQSRSWELVAIPLL